MAAHEQDRGCSCSEYEYALGRTSSLDKVFAIRRRGSEEVEDLCLSIHQARILACTKQAIEVLKHAGVRDREALRSIMDSCSECSFGRLYGKLEAYKISSPPSSSLSMVVYEIVEVPADAAVSSPDPMHWDAEIDMEGILEDQRIAKENTSWQTKMYRVVCTHDDCEIPTNVVYASKQEAYAAAMLKQAALVRNVSQQWDCISVERREDCLRILEGMKRKPLEKQHQALLNRLKQSGLIMFHVEELVISSSFADIAGDATTAAAAMVDRGASLLRNSEETIYLVKSSPSARFGRSSWAAPHEAFPSEDMDKITVIHGAFRESREAYSLAIALQVRDVLRHATHLHLAHKESIRSMVARLAAAAREEPKEQVFASLMSWLMDEMVDLKSCRSFTVEKFVVKSFLEKDNGVFWEEIEERFDEWEEQLIKSEWWKAEGDSP